jgi:hypothetical protein
MAQGLNGSAAGAARSLKLALEADNKELIELRFRKLNGMLGGNLDKHSGNLRQILGDEDLEARLTRITSFEF